MTRFLRVWIPCILLILLSINNLQQPVGAQPQFRIKVSPSSASKPLEVMPGQNLQFTISIQFNTTPTGKVSLDVFFDKFDRIRPTYTLNPRTIGVGETASLNVQLPEDMVPQEFAMFVRGTLEGVESLTGVAFKVTGNLRISVSPQTVLVGGTSPLTISILPIQVMTNVSVSVPGEQPISFMMNGTKTILVRPMSIGQILIYGRAEGYNPAQCQAAVIQAPVATQDIRTVTVTTTTVSVTTVTISTQLGQGYVYAMLACISILVVALLAVILRRKTKLRSVPSPGDTQPRAHPPSRCTMCGREIATRFCPYCGTGRASQSHIPASKCVSCSREITTKFCPHCGVRQ